MVKSMIITVVTLLAAWPAIAQQERKLIREGNELFEKQDFEIIRFTLLRSVFSGSSQCYRVSQMLESEAEVVNHRVLD